MVKLLSLKKGLLVNIGCYILILGKNVWYVHIKTNRLALSSKIKTSCKQCNKHILDLYLILAPSSVKEKDGGTKRMCLCCMPFRWPCGHVIFLAGDLEFLCRL